MGQVYRWDPERRRACYLEPSPAQLAWLRRLHDIGVYRSPAAGLPWGKRPIQPIEGCPPIQVLRSCQDRGWVRSWPGRPEYMLGYYTAAWALTKAGRAEVEHHAARGSLARSLSVTNHPRLAKLMDPHFGGAA